MENKEWTVYILKCSDETYYAGCTNNLDDRFNRHANGQVISTKQRLPVYIRTYCL